MFFFVALTIAALSGMGIGGGGLFALFLKYFTGFSQIDIQAINLLFFLFASGASLLVHLQRRKIYFLAVAIMILFGILGSLAGSAVALSIGGDILSRLFGFMLIGAGTYSFFKRR